jgi:hypothetical protein
MKSVCTPPVELAVVQKMVDKEQEGLKHEHNDELYTLG